MKSRQQQEQRRGSNGNSLQIIQRVFKGAQIIKMTDTSFAKGPTCSREDGKCAAVDEKQTTASPSWQCLACTFRHSGKEEQLFLACQVCGTTRKSRSRSLVVDDDNGTKAAASSPESSLNVASPAEKKASPLLLVGSQGATSPLQPTNALKNNRKRDLSAVASSSWGSLRPPTERDIRGKRRSHKALDAPPRCFEYLVVLDFEWTADNRRKMEPVAEITQFPSVVLQLVEKKKKKKALELPSIRNCQNVSTLPDDLAKPLPFSQCSNNYWRRDALAISAFDTFVQPTFNPILTDFSIRLTGITQAQVDASPTVGIALDRYMGWLQSLGLVNAEGHSQGHWCFVTWGDVDIMQTLRLELDCKSIRLPPCFDRWINLKSDSVFTKHYGREARGGLRACVESVGAAWQGRAHNGLVDSLNTAKIVRHMVQTGFMFTRATRGLDKNGRPFGQKR